MLFRSFDGRLMMALHQPNTGGKERLHLYDVTDNGETLEIAEEATPELLKRPSGIGLQNKALHGDAANRARER